MRSLNDEELKTEETVEEETAETAEAKEAEDAVEEVEEEASETIAGEEEADDKKKKKKDKKQDALKEKIEELEDRTKRQMAEFENFRRRTEKEKATMFDMGARSVIEKMLPIVDNFERGLATVPEDEANKGFADGMNMIYKQLVQELDKIGVKPIESVGKEFDPNFHNAVMQVESEEYESGVVAQEFQKGYTYNDVVIRHAMVAVVQ